MSDHLLLGTLENVKDLTLRLNYFGPAPQWPDSWNQLTSITRLDMDCLLFGFGQNSRTRALLPFGIRSLVDVEVTARFDTFDGLGEEYLLFLVGCLPMLSRLQFNIEGHLSPMDESEENLHSRGKESVERLEAICTAVQLRTTGLGYPVFYKNIQNQTVKSPRDADILQVVVTFQS